MYFPIILNVLFVVYSVSAKCDEECSTPLRHYDEMGCKPVYQTLDDCCPLYYDCDSFFNRSKDKCYFKGSEYSDGQKIRAHVLDEFCIDDCTCQGETQEIDCILPECLRQIVDRGCVQQFKGGTCCPSNIICPPFIGEVTCEMDGKTYQEWQRFLSNDCKICLCKSEANGGPTCMPTVCGLEIKEMKNVLHYYAPYYKDKKCCPDIWIPAYDSDEEIKNENHPGSSTVYSISAPFTGAVTCEMGGKTYQEWQRFLSHDCKICLCKSEPDGGPTCKLVICGLEIQEMQNALNYNPPYYSDNKCCPNIWIPVNDSDEVIKSENLPRSSTAKIEPLIIMKQ